MPISTNNSRLPLQEGLGHHSRRKLGGNATTVLIFRGGGFEETTGLHSNPSPLFSRHRSKTQRGEGNTSPLKVGVELLGQACEVFCLFVWQMQVAGELRGRQEGVRIGKVY